jgi:hypothetical protein
MKSSCIAKSCRPLWRGSNLLLSGSACDKHEE